MIELDRGDFLRLGVVARPRPRGVAAGVLTPLDLEPAAEQFDRFLSTPDFPD